MINTDQKMEFSCNAKAMNSLSTSLRKLELVKVMDFTTAKDIWDKMRNYEVGDNKVKKAKIQCFRIKFGSLMMHDNVDISK